MGPIKMTQSPVDILWLECVELSIRTFEVLKVAVKEVDIVEIREESGRVGRQFAEFVLTLINILWFFLFDSSFIY